MLVLPREAASHGLKPCILMTRLARPLICPTVSSHASPPFEGASLSGVVVLLMLHVAHKGQKEGSSLYDGTSSIMGVKQSPFLLQRTLSRSGVSLKMTRCDVHAGEAELQQTDTMINHMIASYIACLGLGWGLLFFDWALNEVEKHPKAEPWISNAVTIGGASAVLSPIIQWGHAVAYSSDAVSL